MRWILNRYFPEWGGFLLRLALGTVFIAHGWAKLNGPLGTPEGFNIDAWGWPYPALWAWVVAVVETLGGLLILVGLFTRFAAALVACVMATAIINVRLTAGFIGGFELDFALLLIALSLVVGGAGRISVDRDVLGWGAPPKRSHVGETPYD